LELTGRAAESLTKLHTGEIHKNIPLYIFYFKKTLRQYTRLENLGVEGLAKTNIRVKIESCICTCHEVIQ
jgi:hypothetical protein